MGTTGDYVEKHPDSLQGLAMLSWRAKLPGGHATYSEGGRPQAEPQTPPLFPGGQEGRRPTSKRAF